jgi:hypothetical protein
MSMSRELLFTASLRRGAMARAVGLVTTLRARVTTTSTSLSLPELLVCSFFAAPCDGEAASWSLSSSSSLLSHVAVEEPALTVLLQSRKDTTTRELRLPYVFKRRVPSVLVMIDALTGGHSFNPEALAVCWITEKEKHEAG